MSHTKRRRSSYKSSLLRSLPYRNWWNRGKKTSKNTCNSWAWSCWVCCWKRHLYPNSKIAVFVRRIGDRAYQLAEELKADYIFETYSHVPIKFNKAIDTTPVYNVIPYVLNYLEKGGRIVINAIRKETKIEAFPYELIWGERELKRLPM